MSDRNLGYLVMLGALFLILGVLKIFDWAFTSTFTSPPPAANTPEQIATTPSEPEPTPKEPKKPLSSSALLQEAKGALAEKSKLFPYGDLSKASIFLRQINREDKEYGEAQRLLDQINKWQEEQEKIVKQAAAKVLKENRKRYAQSFEKKCLEKGLDFYVQTIGKDASVLKIKWALMSRPLIYKFINDKEIVRTWRELGFKKVLFTDGFRNNWESKLD